MCFSRWKGANNTTIIKTNCEIKYLFCFLEIVQHNNGTNSLLKYHLPKISNCVGKRCLSQNESVSTFGGLWKAERRLSRLDSDSYFPLVM